MEDTVHDFLKKEGCGRTLHESTRNGLFECLCIHAFKDRMSDFIKKFKTFMTSEEQRCLFKGLLRLVDNTGKVPVKTDNENEKEYKLKLDKCYENIFDNCLDIRPASDFLRVYLLAIATFIGRSIYVLQEDETKELSWTHFQCLYHHAGQGAEYTRQMFITMYFSKDDCYLINSFASNEIKPESHGYIAILEKLLKEMLLIKSTTKRCLEKISIRCRLSDVRDRVRESVSTEIRTQCVLLYEKSTSKQVKMDHFTELLNDTEFQRCLYQVLVNNKDGPTVWREMGLDDDFEPLKCHNELVALEKTLLDLDKRVQRFVEMCRATKEELNQRRSSVNKAVIGGSVAGIFGGGLTIAGLVLAPVTLGTSLILTISGASLSIAAGITGGTARGVEAVKQNSSINEIKRELEGITKQEQQFESHVNDVTSIIMAFTQQCLDENVEVPGINLRGFGAIGSALRTIGGTATIVTGVLRVGTAALAVPSFVLGPLSILTDIGFLAEAAHDLRTGSKTGASEKLQENAKTVEMKMNYLNCMYRGNC